MPSIGEMRFPLAARDQMGSADRQQYCAGVVQHLP